MIKQFRFSAMLLIALLFATTTQAATVTCVGHITQVGYLPQYSSTVLSLNTSYRTGIWATTAIPTEKAEIVLSILLAANLSGKETSIQFSTPTGTTCSSIDQYTGAVKIERISIKDA